jgi:hypothetical protein
MSDGSNVQGRAESATDYSAVPATSLPARISRALILAWRPTPVAPPTLDSHLETLSGIERVAEVLRFSVLSVENAISPQGGVRAWLKLNLLVALVLAIPAVLVVPVITYLLSGFATWAQFLATIANNLLHVAVSMVGMVLVVVIGGRIVMAQLASQGRRRR